MLTSACGLVTLRGILRDFGAHSDRGDSLGQL